jgi:hypothetical protein
MSATAFLSKMYMQHIMAKKISQTQHALFVFTVKPERVNMDCNNLTLKVCDSQGEFGRRHPVCTEPSIVEAYAKDGCEIISCKGCIYDKPNA